VTRRRTLTIIRDGRRNVMLVHGWKGGDLGSDALNKSLSRASRQGWVLDLEHPADVVALADFRNIDVSLTDVGGPA
jgi:hypothetical protein